MSNSHPLVMVPSTGDPPCFCPQGSDGVGLGGRNMGIACVSVPEINVMKGGRTVGARESEG